MRLGRRTEVAVASALSLVLVGVVAVSALMADGFHETRVDLNDGGVWVTRPGEAGRLNTQIRSIELKLDAKSQGSDVAQAGDHVVVFDVAGGQMWPVDAALGIPGDERALPSRATVAMTPTVGLVADPTRGRIWVTEPSQLGSVDTEADPTLVLEGEEEDDLASVVVASMEGEAFVYQVGTEVVRAAAPDGTERSIGLASPVESPTITAVGPHPVVLDGSSGVLHLPSQRTVDLSSFGDGLRLQQAGPDRSEVIVATDTELLAVPLEGGDPRVLAVGGRGPAAQPVWVDGCAYGAWSGGPHWVRSCDDDDLRLDVEPIPDDAVRSGAELVYRVNNDRVVLNDVDSGVNLMVDLPEPEVVKDWDRALSLDQEDDQENQTATQRQQQPCSQTPDPPQVEDDSAGTRPERPVIVPVLENDSSDRCDVLVVKPFAEGDLPGDDVADVAIVDDGAALQVTPAAGRTAPIVVRYTAVGKGGEKAGTATVDIATEAENTAPTPIEDLTVVESGQTVRHNVLTNDSDPDGDALSLVEVRPGAEGAMPQFQADGMVTYTAPGGFVGTVSLTYVVADERGETAEKLLTIRVQASGTNLAPKARHDRVTATVGHDASVDLLANDTDPNGDELRVVEVEAPEHLGVEWDPEGTLVIAPTQPGDFWFRYQVADDEAVDEGWVYARVLETDANTPPVAVRDDVVVRPGVPAMVDLLTNDLDADGDLLAVTSVEGPPESGLSIELLELRVARVTASAAFQEPVVVSYVVTDGTATSSGRLVVRPHRVSGLDQPPIALDDTASVRAGNATAVPVLRNDVDPEGELLELVAVDPVGEEEGRVFVQGDELRFQAALTARRTVTTAYTVRDPGGNLASAQVRIDVVPEESPNQPPRDLRIDARTFAGESVPIRLPLVGADPDGDTVALVGVDPSTPPAIGAVEVVGEGFLYTADAGAAGTDVFTFTIRDQGGLSSTGRVRVVVAPTPTVNAPPVAVPDRARVAAGGSRVIAVVANDVDPDGDSLDLLEDGRDAPTPPPEGMGTVRLDGNRLVYDAPSSIPEPEVEVSFTYSVSDGRGGTARGVVTVVVSDDEPPNEPPVALDDLLPTHLANTTATVPVLDNDYDPDDPEADLELEVLGGRRARILADGRIAVELGIEPVTLVYQVTDADGDVATALVAIPVAETLPPKAVTDEVEVEAGATETIDVLANDLNPGGEAGDLELVRVLNARGGSTAIDGNRVRFTADTDWLGSAGFAYVISNGSEQAVGNVRVRLEGLDLTPEFAATRVELPAGTTRQLDLQSLVIDPDTDTHTFGGLGGSADGISAELRESTLVVTAANDSRGSSTTLSFTVEDEKNSLEVEIPVTVAAVDAAPPVAVDDTGETDQGEPVEVPVTLNDVDPLGAGLTVVDVVVTGGPGVGTPEVVGTGAVRFRPDAGFFGTALLTYRVQDGSDDVDREVSGSVRITVYGRPSAPPAPSGTAESHLVRLTWGVPANNGAPITGYVVTSEDGSVRQETGSNAITIDGLRNAQPYRFRVAALNRAAPDAGSVTDDMWSSFSPELIPDQFPDRPSPPTVLFRPEANNGGDGGVLHVSWTPPPVDGSPIDEYVVRASPPVGAGSRTVPASTTSIAWEGLNNGTPYTFTVLARNRAGDSEVSPPSVAETPAGLPGQVEEVTSQRVTDGRNDNGGLAVVSWTAPPSNGDDNGLRYRVTSSPATSTQETDLTTIEWVGLDPNTAYTFTVVAFHKAGDAPASAPSEPVYAEGKPVPPASPRFVPNDNRVDMSGVSSPDTRGPGTITWEVSTTSASSGFAAFNGSTFSLANGQTRSVWVRGCKYGANSSGVPVGCGASAQATNRETGAATVTPFGAPPLDSSLQGDRTIRWTWGQTAAGVSSYATQGQNGLQDCGTNCREKTFGYGERHCLQVSAVGQGVSRPSGEVCRNTAAPPRGPVEISKGPSVSRTDCSTSACRFISVSLQGMGGGPYSLQCQSNRGPNGSWVNFYSSASVANPNNICYFGYSGSQVRVVVNGVTSNTITW